MNYNIVIAVASGAAIGGVLRYVISALMNVQSGKFPLSTLIINLVGSFLLGVFAAYAIKQNSSPAFKAFLTAGICGGFTTFSTFSMETLLLLQNNQWALCFVYVMVSVMGGVLLAYLGMKI